MQSSQTTLESIIRTLGYLALAAIGDAFVRSTNDSAWEPPPADAMYVKPTWSSLVVPIAVLMLAINALAPEPPSGSGPSSDDGREGTSEAHEHRKPREPTRKVEAATPNGSAVQQQSAAIKPT